MVLLEVLEKLVLNLHEPSWFHLFHAEGAQARDNTALLPDLGEQRAKLSMVTKLIV